MAFDQTEEELFGTGVALPLRVTATGGLANVEGEESLFQAVQEIIDTPRGTRPFNPFFGVPPMVYEVVTDARNVAWAIGLAIERNEPRAKDINVAILSEDAASGTLRLNVSITPIGTNTPVNQVFPVYRTQ